MFDSQTGTKVVNVQFSLVSHLLLVYSAHIKHYSLSTHTLSVIMCLWLHTAPPCWSLSCIFSYVRLDDPSFILYLLLAPIQRMCLWTTHQQNSRNIEEPACLTVCVCLKCCWASWRRATSCKWQACNGRHSSVMTVPKLPIENKASPQRACHLVYPGTHMPVL